MREIEFRGKRVDNGEWVYGLFARCKVGNLILPCIQRERENDSGDYIEAIIVNGNTLGQYIGKRDEKNVKIYEGDLLDAGMEYNSLYGTPVVVMGEYFDCETGNQDLIGIYLEFEDGTQTGITSDTESIFTVIGNIHDKEANND